MKKRYYLLIVLLAVLITCTIPVIAEKPDNGNHGGDKAEGPGVHAGQDVTKGPDLTPAENRTPPGQLVMDTVHEVKAGIAENQGEAARNISQQLEQVRQDREQLNRSLYNETPVRTGWERNQNEVRLAVHTLLGMGNLTGGIGQNISQIARDFNNSAITSARLEQQIRERSTVTRVVWGGDQDAARELAGIAEQNRLRIQEVRQLLANTTTAPEVRAYSEDQLRVLGQEQARIEEVASRESRDRGLLGWFL